MVLLVVLHEQNLREAVSKYRNSGHKLLSNNNLSGGCVCIASKLRSLNKVQISYRLTTDANMLAVYQL